MTVGTIPLDSGSRGLPLTLAVPDAAGLSPLALPDQLLHPAFERRQGEAEPPVFSSIIILIGSFVNVKLDECHGFYYTGTKL